MGMAKQPVKTIDPYTELLREYQARVKVGNIAQKDNALWQRKLEIARKAQDYQQRTGSLPKNFNWQRLRDSGEEDTSKYDRQWFGTAQRPVASPVTPGNPLGDPNMRNAASAQSSVATPPMVGPDTGYQINRDATPPVAAAPSPMTSASQPDPYAHVSTPFDNTAARQARLNQEFSTQTNARAGQQEVWKPDGSGRMLGTVAPRSSADFRNEVSSWQPATFAQAPQAINQQQLQQAGAPKDAFNGLMTSQGTVAYATPSNAQRSQAQGAEMGAALMKEFPHLADIRTNEAFRKGYKPGMTMDQLRALAKSTVPSYLADATAQAPTAPTAPITPQETTNAARTGMIGGMLGGIAGATGRIAPTLNSPSATPALPMTPARKAGAATREAVSDVKDAVTLPLRKAHEAIVGGAQEIGTAGAEFWKGLTGSTNSGTNKTGPASSTGLAYEQAMLNRPTPPQAVGRIRPNTAVPYPYEQVA